MSFPVVTPSLPNLTRSPVPKILPMAFSAMLPRNAPTPVPSGPNTLPAIPPTVEPMPVVLRSPKSACPNLFPANPPIKPAPASSPRFVSDCPKDAEPYASPLPFASSCILSRPTAPNRSPSPPYALANPDDNPLPAPPNNASSPPDNPPDLNPPMKLLAPPSNDPIPPNPPPLAIAPAEPPPSPSAAPMRIMIGRVMARLASSASSCLKASFSESANESKPDPMFFHMSTNAESTRSTAPCRASAHGLDALAASAMACSCALVASVVS